MKNIYKTVVILMTAALISGCVANAFSPEQAALQSLTSRNDHSFTLNSNSAVVRQMVKLDESNVVVLVSFSGMQSGIGAQECLYTYHAQKFPLGWGTTSGGGSCTSGPVNPADLPPVDIGSGINMGSSPNDPGSSDVSGTINAAEIVKVRVTWMDDGITEVNAVDGTYLAVRSGAFKVKRVEGLDAQGSVVYDWSPQIAPGKE